MRLLVTGAGGMLGQDVARRASERGHEVVALDRAGLDVCDAAAVNACLTAERPNAVVYCAGYTAVDEAERHEAAAHAVNATAAGTAAGACHTIGARLIYPSTDYVFDGIARTPYSTAATPRPLSAYGRSKRAGEAAVLAAGDHLVVRTSWLYGRSGRNFVCSMLDRAARGDPLCVVDDQRGSPSWTLDVVDAVLGLLEAAAPAGIYHATNAGDTTWYGLACAACEIAGVPAAIEPVTTAEFPRPAPRPAYSVLDSSTTEAVVGLMRPWRAALAEAIADGLCVHPGKLP